MKKSVLLLVWECCIFLCNAQTPPITPSWAFTHIAWKDSINTKEGAINIVDSYLKRNIPIGAVIIDSLWTHVIMILIGTPLVIQILKR